MSNLISGPRPAFFGLLAAVGVWAYWPSIVAIVQSWGKDPDYSHGYLVLPLSLFLLWSRRDRLALDKLRFSWAGLSLLLLAATMRFVAGRYYLREFDAWSIPIFISGLVWTFYGRHAFRWAAPPVFFLWFATPMPATLGNLLSRPLQLVAAQASTLVLQIFGQQAIREGTVILLGEQPLDVARACSGLRMFYGILALAIAFVLVTRTKGWRAVAMVLSAPPVAVFANVLRISITALLYRFASSEVAENFMHDLAGIFMLPLAVVMFILFNGLIDRLIKSYERDSHRTIRILVRYAAGFAVVIVALFFWVTFQQRRAMATLIATADRYEAEEDWSEAARILSRYLAVVEDDKDIWLRYVSDVDKSATDAYSKRRTLPIYRRVWDRYPEEYSLAQRAIELALEVGEDRAAIELAEQLLERSDQTGDIEARRTAIDARAQALPRYLASPNPSADYDWPKAVAALQEAIEELGDDYRYQTTLANIYRTRRIAASVEEDQQTADDLINQMVDRFSHEPMALLARYAYGRQFWRDKPGDQVWQDDLSRALRLCEDLPDKWTPDLYLAAADVASEKEGTEQRRAYLEKAIERFPQDGRAYFALADLENLDGEEGRAERKIEIYRQALEDVEPTDELFRVLLAYEYAADGRLSDARKEVTQLEQLLPLLQQPTVNLARLSLADINAVMLAEQGKIAAAATTLERALAQDEAVLAATQYARQAARVRTRLADFHRQLGMHDLAASNFMKAGRVDESIGDWKLRAAAEYAAAGDPEGAIQLLSGAIQSGDSRQATRIALAEAEIQRQLATPKRQRDWSRAVSHVQRIDSADADPDAVALLTARIAYAQDKAASAKKALEKVVESGSKVSIPSFWHLLARLCWEMDDEEGAIVAVKNFAQMQGDALAETLMRSALLAESSRTDDALRLLQQANQTTDEEGAIRLATQSSLILRGADRNDEARELLKQALDKQPDSVTLVDQLARIAWEDQDWESLEKYEQRLSELNPGEATVSRFYRSIRLVAQVENRRDPRLAEAMQISSRLVELRPEWPLTHVLAGEVARTRGLPGEALAAFQTAWKQGMLRRSVANAILQLMTQLGRYDDAIAFADQIRDHIKDSSQLFDRTLPFVRGEAYQREAIKIASDWVRSEPNSALAWVRLGRILSLSDQTEQNGTRLEQSRKAFQRAVSLSPGDVHIWVAAFGSYFGDESKRDEAIRIVEQFAAQTEIDPLQRAYLLAQFYRALQLMGEASAQYRQVIELSEKAPPEQKLPLLMGAAEFYAADSPQLAERLYRRGLAVDPESARGRIVLASFLMDRPAVKLDEVEQLIDGIKDQADVNDAMLEQTQRIRAMAALRREDREGIEASISDMEAIRRPTVDDQLILAGLYEKTDRVKPALDVFTTFIRDASPQPRVLESFLRFWQENFSDPPQFRSLAEEAYERLATESGVLVPTFRWRLRETERLNETEQLAWEDVVSTIQKTAARAPTSSFQGAQVRDIMVVLLQEDLADHAIRLLERPPDEISADLTPLALCGALVLAEDVGDDVFEKVHGPLAEKIAERRQDDQLVLLYANLLMLRGETQEAIDNYRQVMTLTSDNWETMNNLAQALMETPAGKDEALDTVNKALNIAPGNTTLMDTKAMVLWTLGRQQEAVDILQQLKESGQASSGAMLHLAVIYEQMGNSDGAQATLTDALSMGCRREFLSKRDRLELERLAQEFKL